ncbi:ABC transporter permease [Vibrio cholerae]|uniref:ABC transporter permease n=1 Tax=Vibrio cholerae TaxID=666 RepID=UPI0039678184
MLLAIYNYRGFILGSIKRDFQSRYQRSMLGAVWLVLQPLVMILVYTLIFSQVMKLRLPENSGPYMYSIYLCSGIITWGLFSEILSKAKNVFIDNANLIKKLKFPKICLPVIIVLTAFVNFMIVFSIFVVFLIITGNFPGVLIMDFLLVLILQIILTIGVGMILGVLNVFFRDVGQLVDVILQVLFWATPIVYTISIVPSWAKFWIMLNPLARLISAYQAIFVHHKSPDWWFLFPVLIFSIIFCIIGMHLFRKHSADMVDEL